MPTMLTSLEDHLRHQLGALMFQLIAQSVEVDRLKAQVADLEAKAAAAVPASLNGSRDG